MMVTLDARLKMREILSHIACIKIDAYGTQTGDMHEGCLLSVIW